MKVNLKLYFSCLMSKLSFTFVNVNERSPKNVYLSTTNDALFFLATHLKLSSTFYATQLVDIFAYELPSLSLSQSTTSYNSVSKANSSVIVYQFHSLLTQERIFLFSSGRTSKPSTRRGLNTSDLSSVAELYTAAN
jgi:hypothetical protein